MSLNTSLPQRTLPAPCQLRLTAGPARSSSDAAARISELCDACEACKQRSSVQTTIKRVQSRVACRGAYAHTQAQCSKTISYRAFETPIHVRSERAQLLFQDVRVSSCAGGNRNRSSPYGPDIAGRGRSKGESPLGDVRVHAAAQLTARTPSPREKSVRQTRPSLTLQKIARQCVPTTA